MTTWRDSNTKRRELIPRSAVRNVGTDPDLFMLVCIQDLDDFKPDLAAYNAQKASTLNSSVSSQALQVLATSGSSSASPGSELTTTGTVGQHLAGQGLYRDANSFVYADHKPTEDQIDRVIGKLNSE